MRARLTEVMEYGKPTKLMYYTPDGARYTPEQWRLLQLMDRLEKKVDALLLKLDRS